MCITKDVFGLFQVIKTLNPKGEPLKSSEIPPSSFLKNL